MKVVVPGKAAHTLRVECQECECIFDVKPKDVKRPVRGADPYVKCPHCSEVVDNYAFDEAAFR